MGPYPLFSDFLDSVNISVYLNTVFESEAWANVVRSFDVKDELVLFASDRSNCRVNVFNTGPRAGPRWHS